VQGACVGKSTGLAKERLPQFRLNYGSPMGLAALSDFHLAAAHGGSRRRLRISAAASVRPCR
jgi:hypothetical protein